jgi:hypothetical protein
VSDTGRDSLCAAVYLMTDEELVTAAARIRGTSKRGRRRMLTEAETLALAAVIKEQDRRQKGVTA